MTSTIKWAALLALTAVLLGAFAAHGLQSRLSASALQSFQTGVRYQMWHALALLILAALYGNKLIPGYRAIARLWLSGIILFSGSIYLLSTGRIWEADLSWLGPVTPLGGLLLIGGWAWLFVSMFRQKQTKIPQN